MYIFKKDFVSLPRGNILARCPYCVCIRCLCFIKYIATLAATDQCDRFCGKPLGMYCLPNKLLEFILQLESRRFKPV